MAPSLLFDIDGIDLDTVLYDVEKIESINPHRGHMRLLDGVVHADQEQWQFVAYKDAREDEFWVPGHIPGRPIFPGVLMIEAAAQLASIIYSVQTPDAGFMGFAAVDQVKFRGQVVPGDRLYILSKQVEYRRRRCICAVQGVVRGSLVFEGQITGMPI